MLASGRGSNLQAIIDAIERGELPVTLTCVISDRENAAALGRARHHGIEALALPVSQFPGPTQQEQAIRRHLEDRGVELVALAGYMRILPAWFVALYRWRILNIHPSLLPAFPGLRAPDQAIAYGVKVSGCTVHFVDEGTDTGPIILQRPVPVLPDDTAETLAARILREEHIAYPEALRLLVSGRLRVEGRRVHILPPAPRVEVHT